VMDSPRRPRVILPLVDILTVEIIQRGRKKVE
jgi:hypothetical protein